MLRLTGVFLLGFSLLVSCNSDHPGKRENQVTPVEVVDPSPGFSSRTTLIDNPTNEQITIDVQHAVYTLGPYTSSTYEIPTTDFRLIVTNAQGDTLTDEPKLRMPLGYDVMFNPTKLDYYLERAQYVDDDGEFIAALDDSLGYKKYKIKVERVDDDFPEFRTKSNGDEWFYSEAALLDGQYFMRITWDLRYEQSFPEENTFDRNRDENFHRELVGLPELPEGEGWKGENDNDWYLRRLRYVDKFKASRR